MCSDKFSLKHALTLPRNRPTCISVPTNMPMRMNMPKSLPMNMPMTLSMNRPIRLCQLIGLRLCWWIGPRMCQLIGIRVKGLRRDSQRRGIDQLRGNNPFSCPQEQKGRSVYCSRLSAILCHRSTEVASTAGVPVHHRPCLRGIPVGNKYTAPVLVFMNGFAHL